MPTDQSEQTGGTLFKWLIEKANPEAPHATIEACSIAAIAIVNQKSRWRSLPGVAFHDLLCDPASRRKPRHFNVDDLSVCESDDEEDVKRLEQDRRDAEKVASPNVRCMPRQELSPRPGLAPAAVHSHIFGHGPGGNLKPTGGKGGREAAVEMVGFIAFSKQVSQARSEVPRPRMTNAGNQHTLSLI